MEKILKYGSGWRLGWNTTATVYKGLIGGDDWAIELTEAEWQDLRRLLSQLTAKDDCGYFMQTIPNLSIPL